MSNLPPNDDRPLPLGSGAPVPVFNCIVHVRKVEGGVCARVANLAGIERTAGNERAALAEVVGAFKQRAAELHAAGEPMPWIDPPATAEQGEETRWIPVHL